MQKLKKRTRGGLMKTILKFPTITRKSANRLRNALRKICVTTEVGRTSVSIEESQAGTDTETRSLQVAKEILAQERLTEQQKIDKISKLFSEAQDLAEILETADLRGRVAAEARSRGRRTGGLLEICGFSLLLGAEY